MSLTKPQRVLFNLLQDHSVKIKNTLYYLGPYWDYKTKKITYWLKKNGLNNFRSTDSFVGTSYTDSFSIDVRKELGFKGRFLSSFFSLPLLNKIFKKQVDIARYLFLEKISLQSEVSSLVEKIGNFGANISYSMYLFHIFFIPLTLNLFNNLTLSLLIYIISLKLFCWAFFNYFEKPLLESRPSYT